MLLNSNFDMFEHTSITGCASHSAASRPAPSPETITKELALELCIDARKEAAAQAREDLLAALARDWKGRYVEDVVAEIRRFPESLRTGGEPPKPRWRVVKDTDTSRRQRVEPIGQLRLPVV